MPLTSNFLSDRKIYNSTLLILKVIRWYKDLRPDYAFLT